MTLAFEGVGNMPMEATDDAEMDEGSEKVFMLHVESRRLPAPSPSPAPTHALRSALPDAC